MDLSVRLDQRGGRASAIYRALVDAIGDGRLRPGDRLPPTRELATDLAVSRNTVATAYERLTAEGYLEGRVGAGTYVTDAAAAPAPARPNAKAGALRPRPGWDFQPEATSGQDDVPRYDFRVGLPDASLFPFDTWRRLVTSELRLRANSPGTYSEPSGHPGLRAAIARHLGYWRSVRVDADDIIVTNGTQQALDLIGRVLISPGQIVAVEDPGYPRAGRLFASLGATVVPVPVDAEGLVVQQIPSQAALVYATPSHQFPLGTAMTLGRRRELLAWAQQRTVAVIEDDYDSEFRFSDRSLDPLYSLDTSGRVLYAGTFSKSLLPSLRAGYLVAPPSLRNALRSARQLSDGHGVVALQAALARFMDEGQLARHIRRASKVYAARHDAVVAAVERHLSEWVEIVPSSAGLHICAVARPEVRLDSGAIAAAARDDGIAVDSLAELCAGTPRLEGLVLGYGVVLPQTIEGGISRLARVVRRFATSP